MLPELRQVFAIQHLRRLPGGSQSQLVLGSDGQLYTVKFRGNPQGIRVLVNELIVSLLAKYIGLPVPEPVFIHASEDFVRSSQLLYFSNAVELRKIESGIQMGRAYIPGGRVSHLGRDLHKLQIINPDAMFGILVFDWWTRNSDCREVLLCPAADAKTRAVFIDNGHCLDLGTWRQEIKHCSLCPRWNAPGEAEGANRDFKPWVNRIQYIPEQIVHEAISKVPIEWTADETVPLHAIATMLSTRRRGVGEFVRKLLCSKN